MPGVFTVQPIHDFELPELTPYRTMRRLHEHRQQGIFVAEGEKVVRRLLESDFEVVSALLPEKWFQRHEALLQARAEDVRVFIAEKKLLETLTGFSMYQGVLAVGRVPQPQPLEALLERSPSPRLIVAIDGLCQAENVGGVMRNAAALGVHLFIAGETSSRPFLRRAVRSSMGGIFKLPVLETDSLVRTLGELRQRGIRCVAAHPHTDQVTLSGCDLRGDCCLVLGSEGHGISPAVLAACDAMAAIPMHRDVDSLNVSNASAVFLYEANRQRGRG
jgi:tRNA G18 (ribose-2'-O)-methylase SpoU